MDWNRLEKTLVWAKPAQESLEPDVLPEQSGWNDWPHAASSSNSLGETLWPGNLAEEQMELWQWQCRGQSLFWILYAGSS